MKNKILFKKLDKDCILPKYAHKEDAGMDIFSLEQKLIKPFSWEQIRTGFSMELPHGYESQVRSKSGLALKNGLFVLNSPGTVDENYRGEVCVMLMNLSKEEYLVEKNQKIAQMVINKVEHFECVEAKNLSSTSRGEGGFGSTGLNKKN
ncbi:MAG: dUTP diphosphatase [Clostridia bacterium]|nr:dUTP diphosphatase [Clostridia bacterium]